MSNIDDQGQPEQDLAEDLAPLDEQAADLQGGATRQEQPTERRVSTVQKR